MKKDGDGEKMVSAVDVDGKELVEKAAEELKKQMAMPDWAKFVKTGVSRERPPDNPDWWFVRAGSILRRIYFNGPIGISRLRSYYGGRHRRGHKQAHTARGGGKIVRTIVKDLEKMQLIEFIKKPKRGRVVTPKGRKFIDNIAKQVAE